MSFNRIHGRFVHLRLWADSWGPIAHFLVTNWTFRASPYPCCEFMELSLRALDTKCPILPSTYSQPSPETNTPSSDDLRLLPVYQLPSDGLSRFTGVDTEVGLESSIGTVKD